MKILPLLPVLATLSLQFASAEQVVLANASSATNGVTHREDTSIRLVEGKFSLALGENTMAGTANAYLHDVVERACPTPDSQKVNVLDSSRNILLSFGTKSSNPKDQPGQLAGKKLVGKKANNHWTFEIAGNSKPTTEEAKALHQFAGYTEFSEVFGLLYGTEPRNVGDTWKPDLSLLKKYAPDLRASLSCKLEEVTEHHGVRCARVSIEGTVTGKLGNNSKVDIEINGSVFRDLQNLIDADMDLAGTFKFNGAFGKGANGGSNAVITAPLKVKRTVKVEKP
jgi:hypothetical protein